MGDIAQAGTLAPELLESVQIYINTKKCKEKEAGTGYKGGIPDSWNRKEIFSTQPLRNEDICVTIHT